MVDVNILVASSPQQLMLEQQGYNWLQEHIPTARGVFRQQSRDKKILNLKVPERIKLFDWKLSHNKLQTKDILKFFFTKDDICPIRHKKLETNLHSIFFYKNIKHIWFYSSLGFKLKIGVA